MPLRAPRGRHCEPAMCRRSTTLGSLGAAAVWSSLHTSEARRARIGEPDPLPLLSAELRFARALPGQFVLRLRIEIACIMAFVQLLGGIAHGAVDHSAPPDGGPLRDRLCPAHDVDVLPPLQELAGLVLCTLRQAAVPRPD